MMYNGDMIEENFIPPSNMPEKRLDNVSKIIGTGPSTIKVIKNFMVQEDINKFIEFGKTVADFNKDKTHHYTANEDGTNNKELKNLFVQYEEKLRQQAEELYGLKLTKERLLDLFIHPEGSYLEPHTDIIDYHQPEIYDQGNLFAQQKKDFPFLWSGHLSIICYLNKDYEGGTLYFPEQDVKIIPEPGMFVCFPGNLHFIHGVTKTHGATRYTISLWTRFSDFENKLIEE